MEPTSSKREVTRETFAKIAQLRQEGLGATRIRDLLYEDPDVSDFPGTSSEADRQKIQRILSRDLSKADDSGRWSFVDAENPASAHHVLDVLAYLIQAFQGRVNQLTNAEARWIVRLRTARPDIPPHEIWELIRLYYIPFEMQMQDASTSPEQREALEHEIQRIDAYLAFRPWSGGDSAERYELYVEHPREIRRRIYSMQGESDE